MNEALIVIGKLFLAAVLAALIGYERESHGRSAGLRTNTLVGLGACLLMLLSLNMTELFKALDQASAVRVDPGRIAAYTMAGMGFLGAGVIMQGRGSVRGITTAACLWVNTAVGLAVGAGFYLPAVAVTLLALVSLTALRWTAERYIRRDVYLHVAVDLRGEKCRFEEIEGILLRQGVKRLFTAIDRDVEAKKLAYRMNVRIKGRLDPRPLVNELAVLPGVTRVRWREGRVN
ncbi:MAG: MgtC/SapB family protein [Proteobacteria bacterium]|nr:MgtC/SapB family protein [Pseudomonadota bacterium]MBU1741345.1 MgtC/SapB family protein [Pseudomonadota bacterium]